MSGETVLTNARIVLPDAVVPGTVVARDGLIAAIEPGAKPVAGGEDLEGDYLLPGLVELHTDNVEKHLMPRPGVAWPSLPAILAHDAQIIAAGITTVLDALSVGAALHNKGRNDMLPEAVEAIGTACGAGLMRADHFLHLRCELSDDGVIEAFETYRDTPRVRLVSLMDHTPGQRQFVSLERFKVYYRGKYGLSEADVDRMIELYIGRAETVAAYRRAIAEACRDRGIILASHDDATEAHIAEAAALDLAIAEFPTTVEAAQAAHRYGLATVMGAPNVVRGGSHSGNVSAVDLAAEGLLDALSSDYMPISLLHAAFLLHQRHGATLPQAVAKISANPAEMVGLDDRGAIAAGRRADLIRVAVEHDIPVVRRVWRGGLPVV
ncbi:MAG TPA: alpha-D-ribose 1-methylphosphonate 5-triphosphate diphosphatase [Alphaproteobacteria bacterium]|jgi:alpha-D-ribose 1-methylphosphonate 5-triphosphate diphosphatase|nr:alpha-D-ribose 1-methylphosphonate 5-triphosphate diphosphatase [Alphaproteobacteria bacterium]